MSDFSLDQYSELVTGSGESVVLCLKKILVAKSESEKLKLIFSISGEIAHAGTFFSGAAVAFPVLVGELSRISKSDRRTEALLSLSAVLYAETESSVPSALKDKYAKAKFSYLKMVIDELGNSINTFDLMKHAFFALASGYGQFDLADHIEGLYQDD